MVLYLPHAEGGFGVPFNCVTKDAAFYTTTSRFVSWIGAFSQARQELWLPKDDLRDSSAWSSPPLLLLREIHAELLTQYDCKEVCAPSQSQVNVGASAGLSSQDGASLLLSCQSSISLTELSVKHLYYEAVSHASVLRRMSNFIRLLGASLVTDLRNCCCWVLFYLAI